MTAEQSTMQIRRGRKWISEDYVRSVASDIDPGSAASYADVRIPLTGWVHTTTAFDNSYPEDEFFPKGFPVFSAQNPPDMRFESCRRLAAYVGDRADIVGRLVWITPRQAADHIDRSNNSDPTSLMLDAGHREIFGDDIWNDDEDGNGFLLWMGFTGGLIYVSADEADDEEDAVVEVLLEYRVVAAYLPCDIYGPKGTPMRDLYDTLVNPPRHGDQGDRLNANWSEELVQQLSNDTAAAIEALKQSGHPFWAQHEITWWGQPFPPGGVDDTFGTEYIALHARHLIGSTPRWTQEAYNRCGAAYVAAMGRPLHPDDEVATR